MGNHEMIRDVVEAVTGRGEGLRERVHSGVFELAANVKRLRMEREGGTLFSAEGRDEL